MRETEVKVLVAPLDWGLGHATRCIPVVEALTRLGCKVLIAGSGFGGELLRKRFPDLVFEPLPSYDITYPRKGSMALHLLRRFPRIFRAICSERNLLERIISKHQITHVISDNRYGLHSKSVKCVFMTHQIHVSSGTQIKWLDHLLFVFHRRFLEKFDGVWIVDEPGDNEGKWAGKLSNPDGLRTHHRYIGLLSRFVQGKHFPTSNEEPYQRIALLSGPEPQRSLLEKKMLRLFYDLPGRSLLVRGVSGDEASVVKNTTILDAIDDLKLRMAMANSPIVYCRPGYSTLMDLLYLRHTRAVLIPTPGQTEQSYLGDRFGRIYGFTCVGQNSPVPVEDAVIDARYPQLNTFHLLEESLKDLLDP